MKNENMKKAFVGAAFAAITLLGASTALADGLVASPAQLSQKERTALQQAIATDRAQNPAAYEAVRNVQGYKP
ncbi:MAG: hypothetical protein KC731_39265, partial [Myxococcales bacterium]|nr:hypothetical protein [Myxococcales bacterium]